MALIVPDKYKKNKHTYQYFYKPSVYIIKPNYSIMEIHNKLFTDELLEKIVKKNTDIVFMSDIRTSEAKGCPRDRNVIRDNDLQKNWVIKINPIMASLKFRMPFTDIGRKGIDDTIFDSDVYPYLKGTVTIQAYAQKGSTESRLILKPPYTFKNYSISEQENRFFSFNRVYRSCAYLDPLFLADASGGVFDACYDCTHFYLTAKKILEYYGCSASGTGGTGGTGGTEGVKGSKGNVNWFSTRKIRDINHRIIEIKYKISHLKFISKHSHTQRIAIDRFWSANINMYQW